MDLKNQNAYSKSTAVVFDFGGVIFDWNPFYLYRHFFAEDTQAVELFLEEIRFKEWNHQLDLGYPFKKMVEEQSREFPHYAAEIRAFDERWIEMMGGAIEPTIAVLKELHAQGHPLYALSNWSREKFLLVKPQYEFLDCFERIVISGDEKVAKPDERMFTAFLERTNLTAGQCLFIDDVAQNIQVASHLGFDTIIFESAGQLREEIIKRKLL